MTGDGELRVRQGDRQAAVDAVAAARAALAVAGLSADHATRTYREIAGRLFISMNTLKTHTKHIRSKLEVASRSEAVATARQRGLL